jgi:hypothetical protein
MRSFLLGLLLAALPALSQTAGTPAATSGVSSEWDARKLAVNLQAQAKHLATVVVQIKPETWVAQGAPSAYVGQWNSAQAELKYFSASVESFSKQPERLTLALDSYFRMQAFETLLGSLVEGIRKYQNPAIADLVQGVLNENSNNRDKLRQYVVDLAAENEHEFQVADREAQRCRGMLNRSPAGKPSRPKSP